MISALALTLESQAGVKMMVCKENHCTLSWFSSHQNIDFSCLMNPGKENRVCVVQLNVN